MKVNQIIDKRGFSWMLLLISFMYILLFYIPATASACSCAQPESVQSALSRSDAVFSGKVISVKDKRSIKGYTTKQVIFEVSQTWKGVKESQIPITTGQGGGDCGINFLKGVNYLVYAHESDMYGKKQLITIICDRTEKLTAANEDLKYLGESKPPVNKVEIISDNNNWTTYIIIIIAIVLIGVISWREFTKRQKHT